MAEKRRKSRFPLRLRAKVWAEGKTSEEVGYTENVSKDGVFVTVSEPPKRGTRVRVEIMGSEQGFMVEGIVSHARRVAKELQRVKQAGIGIRFLTFGDLMRQFKLATGEAAQDSDTATEDGVIPESSFWRDRKRRRGAERTARPRTVGARADDEPDESRGDEGVVLEGAWQSRGLDDSRPTSSHPEAAPETPEAEADSDDDRVYAVKFKGESDFFSSYDADIRSGRLFIPTKRLVPFNAAVTVDLYPPGSKKAFRFEARVEKRVEPQLDSTSVGLVVRFEEPSVVIQTLAVIVRALKS